MSATLPRQPRTMAPFFERADAVHAMIATAGYSFTGYELGFSIQVRKSKDPSKALALLSAFHPRQTS